MHVLLIITPQAIQSDKYIGGVIEADADLVHIEQLTLVSARREHYSDSNFDTKVHEETLITNKIVNNDHEVTIPLEGSYYSTFRYFENDVPLETNYFTKYFATIELTYDLGTKRRLLQFTSESEDAFNKGESAVTARMISRNGYNTNNDQDYIIHQDDGIITLQLHDCHIFDELTIISFFPQIFSDYLRIRNNIVSINMNMEQCIMDVIIKSNECRDYEIIDQIMIDLCHGVKNINSFSLFHTITRDIQAEILDLNKDIDRKYATFDNTVCYFTQVPTDSELNVNNNQQQQITSSSVNNMFNINSDMFNYISIIIGILAGMFTIMIYNKISSHSKAIKKEESSLKI